MWNFSIFRVCTLAIFLLSISLIKSQTNTDFTIIVPASDFVDEIPKGNYLTNAKEQKQEWLFNNTGILLNSETNLMTKLTVPDTGDYHLFVRSSGNEKSSFKVIVNDQITSGIFGRDKISWQNGGVFKLRKGINDIKITRIRGGAMVDVLAFSKNPNLKIEDIQQKQLNEDVVLIKEYKIPESNAVKFGDVNGDRKTDFLVLERDFSATVYDNSGKELWHWKAPEEYSKERSEFEAPGVLWDFDNDGRAEVAHWRMIGGKEFLVIADGITGRIKHKTEWPTQPLPHVYNNFRLAVGKLTKNRPNELAVFTDMGNTINITAYDNRLKKLWQHTEKRKKDNLGHYIYPIDLDKDGIDEVLVGSLLLNANGKEIWNKFDLLPDNHDHADSYKFADINGDGKTDLVTANSETGIFIYDGMTANIIWQNVAEHTQQIQVGNFLKNMPGLQVVAGARTYGNRKFGEPYLSSQLYWFNQSGDFLFKWPGNPVNGNPDFVKGYWNGRTEQLFWYKFLINDNGKGQLYFPEPVFHMFDFTGNGAEEVITLGSGYLRIWGSKSAEKSGKDRKKDELYLKNTVVNHTHY
ncbi:hypothetical protein BXY58_1995 [Epilithonimonas arachidiradicis]|uniref:VCBS repeat protein n=1 Tax=Epilithonimonas arachidiradicis TaxID=1617282 RepID=A0A420D8U9_9FLAO|nr:hypothetical protein BXY58_1995 [Epilithonimonas arachidiradicis]